MKRRWPLLVAAAALLVTFAVWRRRSDESTLALGQRLIDALRGRWWAVPVYVGLGIARPVLLLPATLVTVAAGVLFGPWLGLLTAVVAANGSAMLVFSFGAALGISAGDVGTQRLWRQRLQARTFESTLIARLLFVPYDAVNLAAGALRVRAAPFLAATALGSLPGTAAFVIAGSSVRRLDQGWNGLSIGSIAASIGMILVSLVAARVVRRRDGALKAQSR
jgi:uncharacterized membrane protein YdjX (TVP38/TMEM64 family)